MHGASGGVGIAAVQLARAAGMKVIGTAGTEPGRRLVTEQGAHHVLDHRAPGYLEQVLALTNGRGADVILEMLANVNLGKDLDVVAPGGRVVVIGNRGTNNQGTVEINPRITMTRDATILGMSLNRTTEDSYTARGVSVGVRFIGPTRGLDKSSPYSIWPNGSPFPRSPFCANVMWFESAYLPRSGRLAGLCRLKDGG